MVTADLLLWALGGALCLGGLGVLAVYLRGDPARGRARCPRCWHPGASAGRACSECGRVPRVAAETLRTRRSQRVLLAGLALLAGAGAASLASVVRSGEWVRYTPTPVLAAFADLYSRDAEEALLRGDDVWDPAATTRWQRAVMAAHVGREAEEQRRSGLAYAVLDALGDEARVAEHRLVRAVESPDSAVRVAAVWALSSAPAASRRWWPTLAARLRDDPDATVRLAAAQILGDWTMEPDGPGWGPLLPGLNDADPMVRRAAADCIAGAAGVDEAAAEAARRVLDEREKDPPGTGETADGAAETTPENGRG